MQITIVKKVGLTKDAAWIIVMGTTIATRIKNL